MCWDVPPQIQDAKSHHQEISTFSVGDPGIIRHFAAATGAEVAYQRRSTSQPACHKASTIGSWNVLTGEFTLEFIYIHVLMHVYVYYVYIIMCVYIPSPTKTCKNVGCT